MATGLTAKAPANAYSKECGLSSTLAPWRALAGNVATWSPPDAGREMAVSVFLSAVSDEFRAYRDQLTHDLTRHNVAVKVQEDFKDLGGDTLDALDTYIAHCDTVVHLVGDMCGAAADEMQQQALLARHSDLKGKLPTLREALKNGACLPYTQWEAWLALYHGKPLMIAKAEVGAPRGPKFAPNDGSRALQEHHLKQLKAFHRYPGSEFGSPDELAKQIAYTAILDLLVKDYAEKFVRERDVAEGFIKEMAKRVAGDNALDLDGMKQAVRNAIEIYEKEIAGLPVEANLDEIVGRAMATAKEQVDRGQSNLARATLRRAAEEMQREEEERRDRYVVSVTALFHRVRDIALAAYDGDAAAEAIVELARSIHGENRVRVAQFLNSEAQVLYEFGDQRSSNVHLVAAIALRREQFALAASDDDRGATQNSLGIALKALGAREGGTARLKEAVQAYRSALEKRARERAPLDWAWTQNNLGNALRMLGERESGTAQLEEAVEAYRAALEERRRETVPLAWAATQMNLGVALRVLGERESGTEKLEQAIKADRASLEEFNRERAPLEWASAQMELGAALATLGGRNTGTAKLEEAVKIFRAALEEHTRPRGPLEWATTQTNLGSALTALGERESGTARLEEAVAAFLAALEELTRERVPLQWATTQSNLGVALASLGKRLSGTARLEEAVKAHRLALTERTRQRVPPDWADTQNNLGNALLALSERESGTVRLEEAVQAYRAALDEYKRERVPLQWAMAQSNLGNALIRLGERESGTEKFEDAVAAYREALKERTRERVSIDWAASVGSQGVAMILIADRTKDRTLAETAVTQISAAYKTLRDSGQAQWAAMFRASLAQAQAIRDRLTGKS
jgi:tetratricopeptide (TPR) repeat protein